MPSWHGQEQIYLFANLLLQVYSQRKESDSIFSIFSEMLLKNISNEGTYMMKHTAYSIHTFHVW